jgi:hypothetical protein
LPPADLLAHRVQSVLTERSRKRNPHAITVDTKPALRQSRGTNHRNHRPVLTPGEPILADQRRTDAPQSADHAVDPAPASPAKAAPAEKRRQNLAGG